MVRDVKVYIIGLGQAGCNIAEKFKQYPPYQNKVHQLDSDQIGLLSNHERYEEQAVPPSLQIEDNSIVYVITSCGKISGCLLKLLETLKHCKLNVVYIKPDLSFVSPEKKNFHPLILGVLQEYARSGLLENLFLFDNNVIKQSIGQFQITEYFNLLNFHIANIIHLYNVYSNVKPIFSNSYQLPENTDRISTFSVINWQTKQEVVCYKLQNVTKRHYFFNFNKEQTGDTNLLESVESLLTNLKESDIVASMFDIFEVPNYSAPYAMAKVSTSIIQS